MNNLDQIKKLVDTFSTEGLQVWYNYLCRLHQGSRMRSAKAQKLWRLREYTEEVWAKRKGWDLHPILMPVRIGTWGGWGEKEIPVWLTSP